jgi:hypothetical protein
MNQLVFVVPIVLAIGVVTLFRLGIFGKKMLPALPASGPLPMAELGRYYDVGEAPLAWERVHGWELNQPVDMKVAPVDHVVLTPRLLDFCSGATGKLTLVFNFLVRAIERVTFEPGPPAAGNPGLGLVTVFTPSGKTHLIATAEFARTLQESVARARAQG